jgi:hypothetical protein
MVEDNDFYFKQLLDFLKKTLRLVPAGLALKREMLISMTPP